ncbi:MAG: TolC family protein, partial [Methylococcaceae bacterium]
MRINNNKTFFLSLLAAGLLSIQTVQSQEKDSLTLNTIISEVVQNHPAVKKASEDLNSADAKIGIARSNALPNVDFTSSYSRIGPVPVIDVP